MNAIVAFTVVALLVSPDFCRAEGLKLQPGRWELTSTTPNPMGGAPDRRTSSDCVTDEEMKPQFFTAQMQGCTFSDVKSDATSLSWTIECPSPAGRMTGKASFLSTGQAMSGWVEVVMKVNGANYSSKTTWEGRRVGDCHR